MTTGHPGAPATLGTLPRMTPVVVGDPGTRPTWDEWALGIATAVASRADCTRRKVGAVILGPDHRVLSTGYNGYPPGQPGCLTDGACPRGRRTYDEIPASSPYVEVAEACQALHAEENAVLHLPSGARLGATVYVTDEPCPNCQRFLAGAGISRVVWPGGELTYRIGV